MDFEKIDLLNSSNDSKDNIILEKHDEERIKFLNALNIG
jgi:hypothetical protein